MLSPHTLIGIMMMSCLMSVAILGSLLRAVVPGVGSWCVTHALLAVASTCVLIAGNLQARFITLAAVLITLTVVLLLIQGIHQLFGKAWAVPRGTGAFTVVFAALVYSTLISPNIGAKIGIVSVFFVYAHTVVGTLALRHVPHDGTHCPYRFVAAAVYLGALFHVTRAIAAAFGMPQTAFLESSAWSVLFLGLAIVTFPCMSTGIVMLAHNQLTRRMDQLANVDELTGILMRRAFMARTSVLLHDTVASDKPLSIAVSAIGQFKTVNDGFGHTVGDRILEHVTPVVSTRLKPGDLIGRLGGREFATVMVDAGKAATATVTDGPRLTVEHSPGQGVRCTLSARVECATPGDALAATLTHADATLYLAERKGRNRVIIASKAHEGDVETRGVTATSEPTC